MKGFSGIALLVPCVLLTAALARAEAPRLQASHGARTTAGCADVSWLDPGQPPRFLTDVNQAAGSGNCQFHEFAAQNFFALALGASPAIRTWPPATLVFPAEGATTCGAPAALGSTIGPLLRKNPTTAVGEAMQASGAPLVDQNGRYVQYEIRVNPQLCGAISRCQLYNTTCLQKAADADPAFRFPAGDAQAPGVAEVKIAWRVMETCDLPDSLPPDVCKKDDLADYLTLPDITIKVYSPRYPKEVKVTLGLVGFHLVQKTPTHPEWVWSTWEHVSNAPVCAGRDNPSCQDPSARSPSISTASGWALANPLASNDPQCDPANNQNPSVYNCANTSYYKKPDKGVVDPNQPRSQVCRFLPCGGGDQEDQSEIASLNRAIRRKLAGNLWSRYFLVGTLWGRNAPYPDPAGLQEPPAGSVSLANTTMETFIQQARTNCFSCHRSSPKGNTPGSVAGTNIDFTHFLVRAQQTTDPCPADVDLATCADVPAIKPIRSSSR